MAGLLEKGLEGSLAEPFLQSRTVLVVGATGGIGEGVTRALLEVGATVVAAGRSEARLQGLAPYTADPGPRIGAAPVMLTLRLDPGATGKPGVGAWKRAQPQCGENSA
ncbi:SDR family NAD(P)-dependent oxidoreductase [Streptomyces sp. NPDC001401]|uniref:SDR family NAD(P)-dependent oxidoreductase n=1 Tax=Streptomyces sp. NPDC001401 TaxID=3364570 RepID=UPI0036C79264